MRNELKVDDKVVSEVPPDFVSYNFSILSEKEVQPRKKIIRKPTFIEIRVESDPNLQFLWTVFKQSIAEVERKGLNPSKDHQSALLLKCVIQRYFNFEDQRKGKHVSTHLPEEKLVKEEPILVNCLVLGE